jgi:hypothetical protein
MEAKEGRLMKTMTWSWSAKPNGAADPALRVSGAEPASSSLLPEGAVDDQC